MVRILVFTLFISSLLPSFVGAKQPVRAEKFFSAVGEAIKKIEESTDDIMKNAQQLHSLATKVVVATSFDISRRVQVFLGINAEINRKINHEKQNSDTTDACCLKIKNQMKNLASLLSQQVKESTSNKISSGDQEDDYFGDDEDAFIDDDEFDDSDNPPNDDSLNDDSLEKKEETTIQNTFFVRYGKKIILGVVGVGLGCYIAYRTGAFGNTNKIDPAQQLIKEIPKNSFIKKCDARQYLKVLKKDENSFRGLIVLHNKKVFTNRWKEMWKAALGSTNPSPEFLRDSQRLLDHLNSCNRHGKHSGENINFKVLFNKCFSPAKLDLHNLRAKETRFTTFYDTWRQLAAQAHQSSCWDSSDISALDDEMSVHRKKIKNRIDKGYRRFEKDLRNTPSGTTGNTQGKIKHRYTCKSCGTGKSSIRKMCIPFMIGVRKQVKACEICNGKGKIEYKEFTFGCPGPAHYNVQTPSRELSSCGHASYCLDCVKNNKILNKRKCPECDKNMVMYWKNIYADEVKDKNENSNQNIKPKFTCAVCKDPHLLSDMSVAMNSGGKSCGHIVCNVCHPKIKNGKCFCRAKVSYWARVTK